MKLEFYEKFFILNDINFLVLIDGILTFISPLVNKSWTTLGYPFSIATCKATLLKKW